MTSKRDWREVIEEDFPDTRITREGIQRSGEHALKGHGRLPVRILLGEYDTPEEFECYRTLLIQLKLPGEKGYRYGKK